MTSQAIEGTGMTLSMSGGWTSDITEMKLPYSVRQAIDDTHLGDTIVRWVPSKKIEHGTMAIRFWHDPAKQLPITGDPEMMVITYPDGVNHLTVVGFVEKIGKESIKVGELMQTDALVRVIDYPKAAAVPNGSFPMWTGALTGKVVTDIMETASLRYLVDSSPTNYSTIVATNGGYNLLPLSERRAVDYPTGVFGRRGADYSGPALLYNNASAAGLFNKPNKSCTIAVVFRAQIPADGSYSLRACGNTSAYGVHTGFSLVGNRPGILAFRYNFYFWVHAIAVYSSPTYFTANNYVALMRYNNGAVSVVINNVTTTLTVTATFSSVCAGALVQFGYTASQGARFRDFAFWDYALSDTDFESLNDQLCAEYGIT